MKAKNPYIYDWYIVHKKTGLGLGKRGLTAVRSEYLFHTHPILPYTPASVVKQHIFNLCEVKGFHENEFKIGGGMNERRLNAN